MLLLAAALSIQLAAAPAADTVRFRFAWPATFAADVEYSRTRMRTGKPPVELKLRGRLVTEAKGAELRIAMRDWKDAGGGMGPARLDPMVEAAGRITTVATRAGAFVRIDGTEAAVEVFRAAAQGAAPEARPTLERLQKMGPALLTKDANELWSALVQFWQGNDLDVGADYESDTRQPIAVLPGESVRLVTRIRVERRLPCPGGRGACVEARMRSTPDAKEMARVVKRLVTELSLPAAQVEAMVGELSASTEVVLITEPARLVPYRLEKTRVIHMAPSAGAPGGAKPMEGRDTSVWVFTQLAASAPAR